MAGSIVALLTGDIGVGKSTVCQRVVEAGHAHDLSIAGILSQPLLDAQGNRTGLVAVDLESGETRALASTKRSLSSLSRGSYSFDPATFAWAIERVQAALLRTPALVILDEIGPLELEAEKGFAPLLEPLLNAPCPTLLVVRRACRPILEARLTVSPFVFEVNNATREGLPGAIVAALCLQRSPTTTGH